MCILDIPLSAGVRLVGRIGDEGIAFYWAYSLGVLTTQLRAVVACDRVLMI